MKYAIATLLFLFLSLALHAQNSNIKLGDSLEVEAQFPGGEEAWRSFIAKNFTYPKKAMKKGIQGSVLIQFIIDEEGRVTDITPLSGPPELWDAAISIIKKSPRWTPANYKGTTVKVYRKQPFTFSLKN